MCKKSNQFYQKRMKFRYVAFEVEIHRKDFIHFPVKVMQFKFQSILSKSLT